MPPEGAVPPGGGAGFGSAIPGLVPFFQTRLDWVRTQLKSLP